VDDREQEGESMTEWSWYLGENRQSAPPGSDASAAPVNDEFWQRLVKTVPVIVVSAYTAAAAIILATNDANLQRILFGIAVALGLVATIGEFVLVRKLDWNEADKSKRTAARVQVAVGVLAFAVWSYAQADWAVAFGWFQGTVAALLVIGMGVVIYFAEAIKKQLGG
jgi:hypothetical protein